MVPYTRVAVLRTLVMHRTKASLCRGRWRKAPEGETINTRESAKHRSLPQSRMRSTAPSSEGAISFLPTPIHNIKTRRKTAWFLCCKTIIYL